MASLLQLVADFPERLKPKGVDNLQTVFVVCGYGQSRSIPHYIYLSPKVQEHRLDKVAEYLPTYETILSKDSPEMQVEKLLLTDLIHGNQLSETSSHFNGMHPWSEALIRGQIAPGNLHEKHKSLRLTDQSRYKEHLEAETMRLGIIYANLLKDRYLPVSNA